MAENSDRKQAFDKAAGPRGGAAAGMMFAHKPRSGCTASIVVPARNEEAALPATLDHLRNQTGLDGTELPADEYEVLLLLNNCTDASARVAEDYARQWPQFALHIAECSLEPDQAHVGTARKLLMDAACERMEQVGGLAILSTDADTLVAPDWVAANLRELRAGADVVGGAIYLFPDELAALPPGVRLAYERDRRYQELVAELECLLDPVECDPWPRHLQHFGASLACTCEIYRRSGGMPAVKPLEDVAFIAALRAVGARIRHAPGVSISTSARMDGRAEIGLSGQLRHWANDVATAATHDVDSSEWLAHRFGVLGVLREVYRVGRVEDGLFVEKYVGPMRDALAAGVTEAEFLGRVDCDRMIEETFRGKRRGEISEVIGRMEASAARTKKRLAGVAGLEWYTGVPAWQKDESGV